MSPEHVTSLVVKSYCSSGLSFMPVFNSDRWRRVECMVWASRRKCRAAKPQGGSAHTAAGEQLAISQQRDTVNKRKNFSGPSDKRHTHNPTW